MSDEPISLAAARATKAEDCRLWSPLDALKDLVRRIEAGEVNPTQLVVHYFEETADGCRNHHYTAAGVTFPEHLALLAVAQHRTLEMWRA